jgi:gamma-glutamylaminecyclotransferase
VTARVLVYGSLLKGEPNHRLLERATFAGAARTRAEFTLHDLGAFPGMVAGGADAVAGEVYEVDGDTLALLDALESHPTWYRRTPITLADGSAAETYLLTPRHVAGRPVVTSGDWRAHRKEKGR